MLECATLDLDAFIKSGHRNSWIYQLINGHGYNIYVRKSVRYIESSMQTSLDLANIEADIPGTGSLRNLLDLFEKSSSKAELQIVYVENVHNKRLAEFLKRRSYLPIMQISYYKTL